jgi:hypothetical protein
MGIAIAESVAAAGLRYFREGPELLSKISDRASRDAFIQLGISLARQNPNLAMEYYRNAPLLFSEMSVRADALREWAQLGFTLGDYTLAVEYFRIAPSLLKTVPIPMLPYWVGIAQTIAAQRLYDGITFIRTSPAILSGIKANALPFLTFLGILSDEAPTAAITCFQKSSEILSEIPAVLKEDFLTRLLMLARYDSQEGANLFLHATMILKETGADFFIAWIDEGIELLKKGQASRYFTLESEAAKAAARHLKGGLFLSSCAKVLQHFAEGLCNQSVKIKSTADLSPSGDLEKPTTDGHAIYLPPHIRFFEENDKNFEWYKIATAFQAGYLEFGTFYPNPKEMEPILLSLQKKYQREAQPHALSSFLGIFPKPDLIARLFEISEGARIEFLLKREYPGLVAGISRVRQMLLSSSTEEISPQGTLSPPRPAGAAIPQGAPPPQEILIEGLFQVSVSGRTAVQIPSDLQSTFFSACLFLGAVQSPEGTVVHAMKAAASVYNLLDPSTTFPEVTGELEPLDAKGERVRGRGDMSASSGGQSEFTLNSTQKSQSRFVHGVIDPKRVEEKLAQAASLKDQATNAKQKVDAIVGEGDDASRTAKPGQQTGDGNTTQKTGGDRPKRMFLYDEWDCHAEDFRRQFCRVHEESGVTKDAQGEAFYESVMREYKGIIQSLKRAFQYLAPDMPVWIKGEPEGEQFDLNRLVESRVEAKVSPSPSDRIYMRREKKERSVSAAFLLDMSGSTERRLKSGKSVLQIEKEALVLLSHAMDAVGDRFALYGFSGRGNDQVHFHILKNFQTRYTKEIAFCIGNTQSVGQNRDGAAIRHATANLSREIAKTKILVFISDSKPKDDGYGGLYAIADTKMALLEARRKGIHPFCIVINSDDQKTGLEEEHFKEVYGHTPYLVLDQIETLPTKLPQIYKRLTT